MRTRQSRDRTALKLSGTVLFLLGSVAVATACMWITGTSYEGHSKRASGIGAARMLRNAINYSHREEGLKMESALANSTNFYDQSDYAVSLVFVGKAKQGVELLQKLEKEQPGTYIVAANLGTALELEGKNEEALHWIREGIRRNPQSHEGTEWLHAKILEAKIAQEKDPDYFKKHSVLELNPGRVSKGITIDGRTFSPKELGAAIEYQLQERLEFVKPPDPAVASLLFDYAAIEANTMILETARGLLTMAIEYGYPPDRANAELKLYDAKIAARKMETYSAWGLLAAAAIFALIMGFKTGVIVVSSKDLKRPRAGVRRYKA